jgi:glucose-1-phosphate adenylyltransferase
MILGGGKGTRLFPLTRYRSKPAVPLAGKYRLVDIPISNCINSGLHRIYLLTQYNSVSLHRHIRESYSFDRFSGGFVEILAAQQSFASGEEWYQGTADAVRKNLRFLEQPGIKHVLILSGDQMYRMDYRDLVETHRKTNAQVTIAALPISADRAAAFGIVRCDDAGKVIGFCEKPKNEEDLRPVRTDADWLAVRGVQKHGREYLASMGIYLFNRDLLVRMLKETDYQDFGKEVFPSCLRSQHVQVHLFHDYWEDIGTIKSYYEANLALTGSSPPFRFATSQAPIYTKTRHLPPSMIEGATIKRSMVVDGSIIGAGTIIENSVIGLRCRIGKNVTIRNSIIMGSDFYQTADEMAADLADNRPPIGIGDECLIERAIIDKGCRIGKKVQVTVREGMELSPNLGDVVIRDGIIVLPAGTLLPDGNILYRPVTASR